MSMFPPFVPFPCAPLIWPLLPVYTSSLDDFALLFISGLCNSFSCAPLIRCHLPDFCINRPSSAASVFEFNSSVLLRRLALFGYFSFSQGILSFVYALASSGSLAPPSHLFFPSNAPLFFFTNPWLSSIIFYIRFPSVFFFH